MDRPGQDVSVTSRSSRGPHDGLSDGSADAVTSVDALQYAPDKRSALANAHC